ncbi:hypothetical protein LXL04_038064 [Taraxacum kok-saghyz]
MGIQRIPPDMDTVDERLQRDEECSGFSGDDTVRPKKRGPGHMLGVTGPGYMGCNGETGQAFQIDCITVADMQGIWYSIYQWCDKETVDIAINENRVMDMTSGILD